jgi:glutamate/tyrosine decarboxylase-like PLP-dependent enzyme
VVAGAHLHAAALKALALLGFGRDQIEWVPVDDQGRLRPEALPTLDDRTLLLLQAGNVNSGAFDPFRPVVAEARAAGAWVHVDGAFGLWAAAAPQLAGLTAGHEQAHSWSVDAHKTLNVPYDSGIALCADPEALFAALGAEGAYLPQGTAGVLGLNRDGLRYGPEMSRRGRVVELWAALKSLGTEGVAQLVSQLHERARQLRDALTEAGFPGLNDVVFNQVLVDVGPDADAFAAALRESGEAWAGASRWFDQPVLRLSVCSWVTSEEDIARTVRAMVRCRETRA